jgi:hypothetical protein
MSNDAPEPAERRIRSVVQLMVKAGSLEYARTVADSFARLAIQEAPAAFVGASSQVDVEYVSAVVLYLCGAAKLRR